MAAARKKTMKKVAKKDAMVVRPSAMNLFHESIKRNHKLAELFAQIEIAEDVIKEDREALKALGKK